MAVGHGVACPKPRKTIKQLKAKKDRHEAAVKRVVRAVVLERDNYNCRLMGTTLCGGRLEWAHLAHQKRARTRGMRAEERHTSAYSVALCNFHHTAYDYGAITITLGPAGADASFGVLIDGQGWYV